MTLHTDQITINKKLTLESGETLDNVTIAYKTYGELNENKSNAILICHALSGDANVMGKDEKTSEVGWWDNLVGPNKAIDTNKFFVICSNCLGSCKGSTGPASINPKTNKIYGPSFPIITIRDMVLCQKELLQALNIEKLYAVIGPSMGGMQAMQWVIDYPSIVKKVVLIATSSTLSPQAMAFTSVGRHSITTDPKWNQGSYNSSDQPEIGLGIARMIGHITYLSEQSLIKKFGRKLQNSEDYGYSMESEFQIESYLKYQGHKFTKQFDANSYLYLSKALSYFDIEKSYGSIEKAFEKTQSDFLILSITSDWLYPTEQSKALAFKLLKLNKNISFCEVKSDYGHDSFLLDEKKFSSLIKPFLEIKK